VALGTLRALAKVGAHHAQHARAHCARQIIGLSVLPGDTATLFKDNSKPLLYSGKR
jgi:hypothetical protein